VQVANKFDSRVNITYNNEKVNGKSIMGILMLGAEQGAHITIEADGTDAQEALEELEKIVSQEDEI